jgi:hypothetical protein
MVIMMKMILDIRYFEIVEGFNLFFFNSVVVIGVHFSVFYALLQFY